MSLTQCPECSGPVSTESKRCPRCGWGFRFAWRKVGAVFVLLTIICTIAGIAYEQESVAAGAVIMGVVSLFITSVVLVALVDR